LRRRTWLRIGGLVRPAGAATYATRDRQRDQRGHCRRDEYAGVPRSSGDAGRRAQTANARRVRPLHQCRRCQMEQARERQRRAIAGRKVNMRLASFVDPSLSSETRFGIVRGEKIVDVVAAANALHRAVPATTVKIALTSGAQTIAALEELAV